MNTEPTKKPGHLSIDDIRNGCIVLAGDNKEEKKLCMIKEEFRNGIDSIKDCNPSVTFYGSTRIKETDTAYQMVKNLAYRISKELGYAIITGGGGGTMEAVNRGAYEAGGKSLGLTIRLPHEQKTNPYVKDEIPFEFFFARQTSMSYATEVCIFAPGGFGTLSELFEILTLEQTKKIDKIPIILFGSDYWNPIEKTIKEVLLDKYKTISDSDLDIYEIKDSEDEIMDIIKNSKIRRVEDLL